MTSHGYWLDLFTGTTWQEFQDAGGKVSGFRERRWKTVQRIKPGDYLLCYLTGVSRFIAVLEVTSKPYKDPTPIWKDTVFPCRMKVAPVVVLTPETAVPIHDLRDELSIFQNMTTPHAWTGRLRGSPAKWAQSDGEAILRALQEAEANPIERPVDPRKMARRPKALQAEIGPVTVPDTEMIPEDAPDGAAGEPTEHTTVQHLLLKLGRDMGFGVWVARNDRTREVDGKTLSQLIKLRAALPLQFDEATNRTIEYIDVLWLKGNAIVAAFEVESTTSIYSGLLRMSDLIAMQPNLNIPLYLVAPDERRDKVFTEVNRPTFSRLSPPLVDVCRYISFSTLKEQVKAVAPFVRYLKPAFLEELSEVCEVEES
jgi:predicted RNA-binding protein